MKDPDRIRRGEIRRTDLCGVVFLVLTLVAFALNRQWVEVIVPLLATLICLIMPRAKGLKAKLSREGAEITAPLSDPAEFEEEGLGEIEAVEPAETKPADADEQQSDEGRQSA